MTVRREDPPSTATPNRAWFGVVRAASADSPHYYRWPTDAATELEVRQQVTLAVVLDGRTARPDWDVATRLNHNTNRYDGWVRYTP